MASTSGSGKKRSLPESVTSRTPNEGCESSTLTDSIPTLGVANSYLSQEQGNAEIPGHEGQLQYVSPSPRSMDGNQVIAITTIRATGVALGLRRLPAGFYTVVHHGGLEWRTENKPSSLNQDDVAWSGPITIPSDLSATIRLEVYASFEFQPMLGAGEQLRKLTVTVEQLLNRSAKIVPFIFFPKDGDVVSPCSSILVTVERRKRENNDLSVFVVLGPHWSLPGSRGELEDATNNGHSALLHYRKYEEKRDLERSIEHFSRALNICPVNHPCRAAAQSNLAMAKLILCQVENTDFSLEVPLRLYRNALAARPVGHVDRPSTLIQLAVVHFARLQKRKDHVEEAHAEALLQEATELSFAGSHEKRAVTLMHQLRTERRVGPVQPDGEFSQEQYSTSRLTDEDLRILSVRLLDRFERFGDLADLQQAIAILEELVRSTSIWDDRYRAGLAHLGIALSYRFIHLGELSDLENAISRQMNAVSLTPDGHPDKPAWLNNLGNSFRTRFERLGELSDLEDAISTLWDAVDLAPHGHPDKPGCLGNLGASFMIRFKHLGQLNDLENAISRQRNAVHLTPHGHPAKPVRLNGLGASFTARFERLGQLSDLEDAISTLRDAVDLTPHDHPHKPAYLSNLGTSFRFRFERIGQLSNLEDAISTFKEAVDLTPNGHPHKSAYLNNLGISIYTRFKHLGQLSDLEDAISGQMNAVDLAPHGHPEKPAWLNNLATSLGTRFERLGELSDLEDEISMLRAAVDLTPHGHPRKPGFLHNLGTSFRTRFQHLGQLSDLEDSISMLKDAVHLTPHGHPDKPAYLNNLGNSLGTRFHRLGQLSNLEEAILMLRDAIDLTPHGHPHKPIYLSTLGASFITRFERLGQLSDLEDAISMFKDGVGLTPRGHPRKPSYLNSLGTSFRVRFDHLGQLNDLEDAVSMLRDSVDLTPHGHPHKPARLNHLGTSFISRFERLGELSDLEDGISVFRVAVDLTSHGHPDKPGFLNALGNSLTTRFKRHGELSDLEDAILMLKDAVDLTPHGHPQKPGRLNNLGTSFNTRFARLGQLGDLEDGISMVKRAVDLTPHGHPHKSAYLNNLGHSFFTRFKHLGQQRDLEDAISMLRDAVDLIPDGHPNKPATLNSLGVSFRNRFERFGQLSDLEDAISILRDAVNLSPYGHTQKPSWLSNLGNSFRIRFDHLGDLGDLEEAISMLRNAVDLTPHGHPEKPGYLNNVGACFVARFHRLRQLSDLNDAISTLRDAVDLTPHGHPDKPARLYNFGNTFKTRFEHLGELTNLEHAVSLFSHAASTPVGPINVRFAASQNWISCARRIRHHSLLHAYSVTLNLLPQLAWIGLSLSERYSQLTRGADVVREAAAAALDSGLPETAVEWLEQGRSVVWGELFQLRSSYEELSSAHPDHARRLRELSAALDHASATLEKSLSALSEQTQGVADHAVESSQDEGDKHRALAIEWDKLLQEVRRLPGFEHFLLRKRFSALRASAHSGPVVMLNAAESRCDALIVLANADNVIHVPLPNFAFRRSVGLQNMLEKLLGHTRDVLGQDRKGDPSTRGGVSWEALLSTLWTGVIKPVLDALAFPTPGDISRIFWCPTGPFVFLPIHAAGFYDAQHLQPGYKLSDFVVSSYVPTLSILTSSPCLAALPSGDLRLLAVRQPSSDGLPQLPGVTTELKHIREVIERSSSAPPILMESSIGTVEEVLSLMKEADWVHFACHGIQDAEDSGLCLANKRRLKLRDIVALSRPRGGLAFLSACQTATGDEGLSDEAIHVAAGMLFAGYGGVIGTMWSISDRLAPVVARDVYEQLFRNGTRPDHREAARALHEAIGRLRDGNASFVEWVPFIHVGL